MPAQPSGCGGHGGGSFRGRGCRDARAAGVRAGPARDRHGGVGGFPGGRTEKASQSR
ncbi:hypothetical protein APASM_4101 [Actinosynnema pretiosum subsp. pretiosum]|nr:hypothetical protein APASM_4101 [Actinosynnema pretiosum subsp. pretiosum]